VRLKHIVLILALVAIMLMSAISFAGEPKTAKLSNLCEVVVRPTKVANHFEIEIILTNDKPIAAITFPFRISAGENKMAYDSISFDGYRAEFCAAKIPNPDTANQIFNLGILASMTPPLKYIEPGSGTIAKLYFTGDKGTTLKNIEIDTTFFPPSNHLMGVLPDAKTNIYPDFKFTVAEDK
jgi:hypothetical protein